MTPVHTGHLEYYTRHGINPVRYDMADLRQHFDRRSSLYRMLGLTPLAVRKARVLEIAPGTGQNSLYLASLRPERLTLVEPNPVARRDIAAVYSRTGLPTPEVIGSRLEEYEPDSRFDVVVCENWLGRAVHERQLLRKLGSMVVDQGILVLTAVSPVGIIPNMLRRYLSHRLLDAEMSFEERTARLCQAFESHLRTMPAMTRGVIDWVHDNMLNPAYFGVVLTLPMILAGLGETFDVLGSSPRFGSDWRWFKGLCGTSREFNTHFLNEYHANVQSFLDHRHLQPAHAGGDAYRLEAASLAVCDLVQEYEAGRALSAQVEAAMLSTLAQMNDLPHQTRAGFDEFFEVVAGKDITPEQVAGMKHFRSLFGRETLYVSLEKRT
jgi:2-polyprenyl-3-methyl-5-hydroxy-6-metoxy-1,4-benzoquinol methylase